MPKLLDTFKIVPEHKITVVKQGKESFLFLTYGSLTICEISISLPAVWCESVKCRLCH